VQRKSEPTVLHQIIAVSTQLQVAGVSPIMSCRRVRESVSPSGSAFGVGFAADS
jgi:hypothetical protein